MRIVDGLRRFGLLEIELGTREVRFDSAPVALTRLEFDLVEALTRQHDRVWSRPTLMEQVWGLDWLGDGHTIEVHVANLRRKIDRNGARHVQTVRGIGYRWAIPPS
ncbi:MAG: DNA-binding response OmpR family regulator [Candidatus Poriferisodalaceae bacterium]|jgi:DNA-binding response OmpR family regulator